MFAPIARRVLRFLRDTPEEELRHRLRGWRKRALLRAIFRAVPGRFDRRRGAQLNSVVEIRLRGLRDEPDQVFQLHLRGGRCRVRRRRLEQARVLIACDDMPFLKLVAGAASGPDLFMRRRLDIDGDLFFALRLPTLFRVPSRKG